MTVLAYAAMCLIWGTTWLAIKFGLHTLGPLTGVGLRFTIAGLFLYGLAAATGSLRPARELPWKVIFVLSAMLFGGNYILTYTAETHLDSGLVSVLFGTLPFFTFALAHYMVGERTTPRIWIGTLLAFAGLVFVSLTGQVAASPLYAAAAIGAAAVSSFANVYAKRHSHHAPLTTLPPAMLIAGVCISVLGFSFERTDWHAALASSSAGALLYLAVFGSGIAFFLNMWLLQRLPVWIIGLSSLIVPALALIVGVVFGGETVSWREAAGAALILSGLAAAMVQPRADVFTGVESSSDRA